MDGGEPLVVESRLEWLMRTGQARPRFLQGVFPFLGAGFHVPSLLNSALTYTVPDGRLARLLYVRAGNLSDEMTYLSVVRDERPMRYFPIQARGDVHVTLAITEDIEAGSRLEVHFAAPEGLAGSMVLDVGLVELADQG
jgi:assimilatory nitrate reductase catalytic subunit